MTIIPLPGGASIQFGSDGSVVLTTATGKVTAYTAAQWTAIESGAILAPSGTTSEAANLVAAAVKISAILG